MPTIYEVAEKVKSGANIYLIDVRRARDYMDFHIDGSVNVPFDDIARLMRAVPDKNAQIYVFCGNGQFSRNAATVLEYKGYVNVHDLGALE